MGQGRLWGVGLVGLCLLAACRATVEDPGDTAPLPRVACTPLTCEAAGAHCGTVEDGCGGTLECGGCPDGQQCRSEGGSQACVPVATAGCTPKTCATAGLSCGTADDGCGGTLQCGPCGSGGQSSCGEGTTCTSNPGPSTGDTRQVEHLPGAADEAVVGLASDAAGDVYVLRQDVTAPSGPARQVPLVLSKYDRGGRHLWTHELATPGAPLQVEDGRSMAATPSGDVYLLVGPWCELADCLPGDFGLGEVRDTVLLKLDPEGRPLWQRPAGAHPVALAASETAVVVLTHAGGQGVQGIQRFDAQGTLQWRQERPCLSVALDPSGNVVLGCADRHQATEPGGTTTDEPFVLVLDPQGGEVWSHALTGVDGAIADVGTSAKGTVVVTGTFQGRLDAPGGGLRNTSSTRVQPFLAVLEAKDGAMRWAHAIGQRWKELEPGLLRLDVLPLGEVAVSLDDRACGQTTVLRYNLAGDALWSRMLPETCDAEGEVHLTDILTPAGGDTVLGGAFRGTVDFGKGSLSAAGSDGVLLWLGR